MGMVLLQNFLRVQNVYVGLDLGGITTIYIGHRLQTPPPPQKKSTHAHTLLSPTTHLSITQILEVRNSRWVGGGRVDGRQLQVRTCTVHS